MGAAAAAEPAVARRQPVVAQRGHAWVMGWVGRVPGEGTGSRDESLQSRDQSEPKLGFAPLALPSSPSEHHASQCSHHVYAKTPALATASPWIAGCNPAPTSLLPRCLIRIDTSASTVRAAATQTPTPAERFSSHSRDPQIGSGRALVRLLLICILVCPRPLFPTQNTPPPPPKTPSTIKHPSTTTHALQRPPRRSAAPLLVPRPKEEL